VPEFLKTETITALFRSIKLLGTFRPVELSFLGSTYCKKFCSLKLSFLENESSKKFCSPNAKKRSKILLVNVTIMCALILVTDLLTAVLDQKR